VGIRVRVEVRASGRPVITSALLGSGYEAEEPEVLLPPSLAEELHLAPLSSEDYRTVGARVRTCVLGYVELRVVASDRQSDRVRARAVSVEGEQEVLLSDKLIDALGVEPVKPGRGLWRFSGEEGLRASVEPELWP